MEFRASRPGRAHIGDREARVICHRNEHCLAEARVTRKTDSARVHMEIRFQVIHGAARTPGPRPQCSPIIELARLSFVHEPDDAASQTRAIVWLNGYRRIQRKSPPYCYDWLLALLLFSTPSLVQSGI